MSFMSQFDVLPQADPDPILTLNAMAKAAGPAAINATVGSILDDDGTLHLLPSVKRAMEDLARHRVFSYDGNRGIPEYRDAVNRLLYGKQSNVASTGTVGGSEAIWVQLHLAKLLRPEKQLIIPTPAWASHVPMAKNVGIPFETVPYLREGKPTIEHIVAKLREGAGSVLLQGGGHNPSGLDLSVDQWEELGDELKKHDAATVFDVAYQGISGSPDQDAKPLRSLVMRNVTTLAAWSASKSHTIYNTRTGHASVATSSSDEQRAVESYYDLMMRGTHSSSPGEGQRIVAHVQQHLSTPWRQDLTEVRGRIDSKRSLLQQQLPERFQAALDGSGLFAQLPLTAEQIVRLRDQHKVFLLPDGRVNIAGIPLARVAEFCDKVKSVTA